MTFLIVFLGAGIGGALRHGVNLASMRLGWTAFPLATLGVNVLGSFVMGLLTALFAYRAVPQEMRLLLTTGLLGGFTTFSTFSLDFALLWERGRLGLATAYGLASVLLSVGALFVGLRLFRLLVRA